MKLWIIPRTRSGNVCPMPTFARLTLDNHHEIPVLNILPGGFSSNGTVLTGPELIDVFWKEHAQHADGEDSLLYAFPKGAHYYIRNRMDEVLTCLLFLDDQIFSSYTAPLIKSVYGWNLVMASFSSDKVRAHKLRQRESSTIRTGEDCVKVVREIVSFLSQCVDLTDSMKLPLSLTSTLFSYFSVLLAIPLDGSREDLRELAQFLLQNPQIEAIEQWCESVNKGCKLWSSKQISWRRSLRCNAGGLPLDQGNMQKSKTKRWWQYLGWSDAPAAVDEPTTASPEKDSVSIEKSHNVTFAVVSVAVLFVFLTTTSNP